MNKWMIWGENPLFSETPIDLYQRWFPQNGFNDQPSPRIQGEEPNLFPPHRSQQKTTVPEIFEPTKRNETTTDSWSPGCGWLLFASHGWKNVRGFLSKWMENMPISGGFCVSNSWWFHFSRWFPQIGMKIENIWNHLVMWATKPTNWHLSFPGFRDPKKVADEIIQKKNWVVRQPLYQGTMGCTPNSVPMAFVVFSMDSWGL